MRPKPHVIPLHPQAQIDASEPLRSPGRVLREDHMLPYNLFAPQLAQRTGIPVKRLRRILCGMSPVDTRDALRLAAALDTSALYWLLLQARHDLDRTQRMTASSAHVQHPKATSCRPARQP